MYGGVFDSDAIEKLIKEKEKLTEVPNFWDNHEEAEKVMAQIRKLKNRIEPWKKLLTDIDDLEAMYELAMESQDSNDEEEVRSMLNAANEKFEKLKMSFFVFNRMTFFITYSLLLYFSIILWIRSVGSRNSEIEKSWFRVSIISAIYLLISALI